MPLYQRRGMEMVGETLGPRGRMGKGYEFQNRKSMGCVQQKQKYISANSVSRTWSDAQLGKIDSTMMSMMRRIQTSKLDGEDVWDWKNAWQK